MKKEMMLILSVLCCGCSLTLPVDGKLRRSDDRFIGEATGYIDRTGNLSVSTISGKKCFGEFKYLTSSTGDGVFRCDDGREGKFLFNSVGNRGNGLGKLNDGEEFVFYFGDPSHTRID